MQSMIRSKGGRCKQRERICVARQGSRSAPVIVRVDAGEQRVIEGRRLIDDHEVPRVIDHDCKVGSLMRLRMALVSQYDATNHYACRCHDR